MLSDLFTIETSDMLGAFAIILLDSLSEALTVMSWKVEADSDVDGVSTSSCSFVFFSISDCFSWLLGLPTVFSS